MVCCARFFLIPLDRQAPCGFPPHTGAETALPPLPPRSHGVQSSEDPRPCQRPFPLFHLFDATSPLRRSIRCNRRPDAALYFPSSTPLYRVPPPSSPHTTHRTLRFRMPPHLIRPSRSVPLWLSPSPTYNRGLLQAGGIPTPRGGGRVFSPAAFLDPPPRPLLNEEISKGHTRGRGWFPPASSLFGRRRLDTPLPRGPARFRFHPDPDGGGGL